MNSDILSELYNKYSKHVFFYALSLCNNKYTAEDLMQECFVKAILSLDSSSDKIKIWLFKVCRNIWIDQVRKNKHLAEPQEKREEAVDANVDVLSVVIIREETRTMYQTLLTLPDHMREILMLSCIGAIRTLICRARKTLRKKMEDADNGF